MSNSASVNSSFLDRLIDVSFDSTSATAYHVPDLIASVERDLEHLLNSRQTRSGLEDFPSLQNTVIAFGLPDAQQFDLETPQARYHFAQTIEAVIEAFEPRVAAVVVEVLDDSKPAQSLRMNIRATLNCDVATEIAFETTLKLATGQYQVKSAKS